MKKPAIALMALACTLAVSSAAFAAVPAPSTQEVTGQYHANTTVPTVYSVDVAWDSMAFTYTVDNEGTWNPNTHKVEGAAKGVWSGDGDVKVTNHSNAMVNVAVTYAAEERFNSITGSFANGTFELATAEGTAVDNAPNATATLSLSGDLDKSISTSTKLGTATVTISAAN